MTLKQIQAFYWAATLGNFAIAAERLHISQSTLSKRVFELEAALGVQLFDRSSKQAQLSEHGTRLLRHAAQMLDLTELIQADAEAAGDLAGTCRIGITELGSLTWLPRFIAQARALYPRLIFQPYVDLARGLERMVHRGELDCAVAPTAAQGDMLAAQKICDVECTWMASPARIDQGAILKPAAMETLPVITMTAGSGMTAGINQWSLAQGIRLNYTLASNSMMAIAGLTVADIGISYLPRHFMAPWLADGRLTSFTTTPATPNLGYYFLQRSDDKRELVARMKALLLSDACGLAGGKWVAPTGTAHIPKTNMKRRK
ncbi:LysR family transcriptional regulator [Alcaligenaceae bacterium B3P038]|nr:LysR family transcriptional regulator [Alcaligenaceae bacterium B3P038]